MATQGTHNQTIRVHLIEHRKSGLLAAVSDDLHGLVVHGDTEDEIRERLPAAIRDLLEADGRHLVSLDIHTDDRHSRAGFGLPGFIADAALAA